MRYFRGANKYIQHVKPTPKTITFRLKCDPRITVTAPAVQVHEVDGGYGIVFCNENDAVNTIVMGSKEWAKEDK